MDKGLQTNFVNASIHCNTHYCTSQDNSNNDNLQAFQLIVHARYLLGVPNPSPVSQHALT